MKQLPHHIVDWLTSRTISVDVINDAQIGYSNNKIVIPIFNTRKELKFNKYRKDPADTSAGPKYSYDAGGVTSLYGVEHLNNRINHIIICEGELDALALRSHGFTALSSTGGCGTFRKGWAQKLLEYDVPIVVCYDNDEPGANGMINVASLIKGSYLAWLPDSVGEKGDITDFLKAGGSFQELMDEAVEMPEIEMPESNSTKKDIKVMKQELLLRIRELMDESRAVRSVYGDDKHIQMVITKALKHVEYLSKLLHRKVQKIQPTGGGIASAKAVPITRFIDFNPNKCAKCIWHDEKTPSMKYYEKSNKVKCFGCGKSGDVVDVVQQLQSISLPEAIKLLTGE